MLVRAESWIAQTMRSRSGELDQSPRYLLTGLFGLGICHAVLAGKGEGTALAAVAVTVGERIQQQQGRPDFDLQGCEPRLLLLGRYLLGMHGQHMRSIDVYTAELAGVVTALDPLPARHATLAALLRRCGYDGMPVALPEDSGRTEDEMGLLVAGSDRVRDTCAAVEDDTLFGARPSALALARRDRLHDALSIVLLHVLRRYDLELGSFILRALCYLRRPATPRIVHAVQFLMAQQRADGSFGFYDSDLGRRAPDVDSRLDVYLPITVSCVWALSEILVPEFSLLGDKCGSLFCDAIPRR